MSQSRLPLLQSRQLEAIVAVARLGSVRAAARSLGLPQPAVSRLVAGSEKLLGVPLFERSPTGTRTTRRGEWVLEQAVFALRALSSISEHASDSLAVVRVGCIPRVMHVLIPQLLARLGDGNPRLRLQISVGTSNEMAAELENARLDFIIARRTGGRGLDAERLYSEATVVACGIHNPAVTASGRQLTKLARLSWVLPKRGFYSRDALDALVSSAGLPPIVPVIECDSFESNLSVVASTRFITLAPEFAARRSERLGMVRIVHTRPSLGSSPVMLQYRNGQEAHPAFKALRAAALAAAANLHKGKDE